MVPPEEPESAIPESGAHPVEVSGGAAPRERYNTQFIVSHFDKDRRRTRTIALVVAGVLILVGGLAVWHASQGEAKPGEHAAAGAHEDKERAASGDKVAPVKEAPKPAEK